MLVLVISLLPETYERNIWKQHYISKISVYMECFFTFQLFSQYAEDSYIIHPKINPEAGFVDDTYLMMSVSPNHSYHESFWYKNTR